jgi:hypothetical protein
MGWYLWQRHPVLATDAQLSDAVKTPPHAPGAPAADGPTALRSHGIAANVIE